MATGRLKKVMLSDAGTRGKAKDVIQSAEYVDIAGFPELLSNSYCILNLE